MRRYIARYFVEAVAVAALGASVIAGFQWAGGSGPAALLGVVPWLIAVGFIAASKLLPAERVRRMPRHPRSLYVLSAVAVVAAAALGGPAVAASAIAGASALALYTLWYVRQHRPSEVVEVGAVLPDFPLQTLAGREVGSAQLRSRPHVILFYRGAWCPFCVAQIESIAAQYRELDERGVGVALISSRHADETAELSRRFDAPMDFYVDGDGAAAAALDIVQEGGTPVVFDGGVGADTVVPTVIITRAGGAVAWIHHSDDHRVRPEPSVYLEVIEREGVAAAGRAT